jgi:predicted nucleotidyltransferase
MISNETIQAMVNRIVERFQPERVVLFGSYARGEATEDSDVDLLVEVETDPRPNRRGNPIHHLLAEEFRVPTDVIIRTVEQVRKYRDARYSLTHEAFTEGKVLYERKGN